MCVTLAAFQPCSTVQISTVTSWQGASKVSKEEEGDIQKQETEKKSSANYFLIAQKTTIQEIQSIQG